MRVQLDNIGESVNTGFETVQSLSQRQHSAALAHLSRHGEIIRQEHQETRFNLRQNGNAILKNLVRNTDLLSQIDARTRVARRL